MANVHATPDFVVNQTGQGTQSQPVVTALADGGFVAMWWSRPVSGGDFYVVGRVFGADGAPAGDDFQVNTSVDATFGWPTVAALPDGGFVAAWYSGDVVPGSENHLVRLQLFESDGTPRGSEFVGSTLSAGGANYPSIAVLSDGSFVATWIGQGAEANDGDNWGIRAHLFAADGTPAAGDDFVVNSTIAGYQQNPAVAGLPGGGFVIVYETSDGGDGAGYNAVRARIFDEDGVATGADFLVNTTADGNQQDAKVAVLSDGRFVVTWESNDGGDGAGYGIRARIFAADGTPEGDDFIANSSGASNQTVPAVTDLPGGGFVIAWTSNDGEEGGGTAIRARIFDENGDPTGADFIVNTTTQTGQQDVRVDTLSTGEVVFTWFSADGGDGDGYLIRGRVLDLNNGAPPTNFKLDGANVDHEAALDTVVGTLSAVDAEGGALTYTLTDDAGGTFILVTEGGETKIVVAGAIDFGSASSHQVTVEVEDEDGNVVAETFTINVKSPIVTIDASTASSGIDFNAFVRGGFVADVNSGGFPVFDNGGAFAGEEMVLGYGTGAEAKYVLAHGFLEYYFNTHTVYGEIGTIEYGRFGSGSYDSNGYLIGADVELRITGLNLANPIPTNPTEEADIEATGAVHNFATGHMYGPAAQPDRFDLYANQLAQTAQKFIGSAHNDVYVGTAYDDIVEGGAGNDWLSGGGGNDAIDGGDGVDTVYYDGIFAFGSGTYSLTPGSGGAPTTVTDSRAEGGTGVDSLTNVELIKFNNLTLNLTNFSINYTPTDLALDDAEIGSDAAIGDVVGSLLVTDQDSADSHTFEPVDDAGGAFVLDGAAIKVAATLTEGEHTVRVRVTDSVGNTFEKDIPVSVAASGNAAPVITVASEGLAFASSQAVGAAPRGTIDIHAVDVDNDGDLDLIAGTYLGDAGTYVLLNDGAGNFSLGAQISATNAWKTVAVDLDGDGYVDYAGVDYGVESLVWHKGNGDGTFGAAQVLAAGNQQAAAAADMDGDGDIDVISVQGAAINLQRNNGDGTFTQVTIATGASNDYAYGVAAADLNGDGELDFVATTNNATFTAYVSDGAGGFTVSDTQSLKTDLGLGYGLESVTLGDIDGDGNLDAVAIGANDQGIYLLRGNGDGTFADAEVVAVGTRGALPPTVDLELFDVNGDGRLDIIAPSMGVTPSGGGTLSWYELKSDDTFEEHVIATAVHTTASEFVDIAIGDFDGDGRPDLLSAGAVYGETNADTTYIRIAPGAPSLKVDENAATALTGVTFSDDGTGEVVVTFSVDRGTLSAVSGAGVVVGGTDTEVTLTGTVADINAFIAGGSLTFLTDLHDETAAVLSVSIDDQNPGSPATATTELLLAVEPMYDEAPTNLTIDNATIAENSAIGTVIGTFSATDPEGGPVTYSLVYNAWGVFTLDGDKLVLNQAVNHEAQGEYQITVRATDIGGEITDQTITITVTNVNEAPTNLALSSVKVVENSPAGTVVGNLSVTDPDNGDTFTYEILDDTGAFEIVDGQLLVKDLGGVLNHSVTVQVTDAGGLTTEKTFKIVTTDAEGNPLGSAGLISIDASSATSGMDLEAFIRGGFTSDAAGGGFPVFDNGAAFIGEEMFIGYGTDATSKYVFAHGELEYFFGTHTVTGTINTIEYGTLGSGTYDANGYFNGGNVALKITGLNLNNPNPSNPTEEAEIEANGAVHNFAIAHMYGASADPARLDKYADALDDYAQHFIGSAFNDVYTGTAFNDVIEGGAGNDVLYGGGGNDEISGGTGTNTIEGGEGTDTYVINGNRADYNVYIYSSTYIDAKDSTSSDTLKTMEFVRFNDVLINLITKEETPITANFAPTDLALSASTVAENVAVGAVVGVLSATDPEGQPLTYTLSDDAGGRFEIVGNELKVKAGLDFETATSHSVKVKVSDGVNEVEETFVIEVTDIDESIDLPPVGLALSANSIAEDAAVGTVVGVLSATDPEGGAVSYALSADADQKFEIVGNELRVKAGLDYETRTSHEISVTVSDEGGNTSTEVFTIGVEDVLEPTILGKAGGGKVKGTKGDDVIFGQGGKDKLDGGKGDDVLVGGAGKDVLKGGKGADTFVFQFASDSTVKAKGRDLIQDFNRKQGDKIDVSGIDPLNDTGMFDYIGKSKFSGEAGELRWQKKGGQTIVSGDIDGDGKADFSIALAKSMAMKEADFIL